MPPKKKREKGGDLYAQKQAHQLCLYACMYVHIQGMYVYTHTDRQRQSVAAADVAVLLHLENLHHALSTLDPAYSSGTWFDPHAERD